MNLIIIFQNTIKINFRKINSNNYYNNNSSSNKNSYGNGKSITSQIINKLKVVFIII